MTPVSRNGYNAPGSMPKVHFLNEVVTVEVPAGKTVYDAARDAKVNLFKGFFGTYNCGGKGRCMGSGCKVWVNELESGAVARKPPPFFKQWLWRITGSQAMACQATVRGDCEIRTQPGALEFAENATWDPDGEHHIWQDRLKVVQKKKKAKAKAGPAAAAAEPEPEDEAEEAE